MINTRSTLFSQQQQQQQQQQGQQRQRAPLSSSSSLSPWTGFSPSSMSRRHHHNSLPIGKVHHQQFLLLSTPTSTTEGGSSGSGDLVTKEASSESATVADAAAASSSSSSSFDSVRPNGSTTVIDSDTIDENEEAVTLVVLKEFEKKQAALAKRKESALAQVQKFDSTLQKLERKKQDYLNGLQLAGSYGGKGGSSIQFSETPLRSVVKSFVWRVVAGLVTLVTSYQFSKSVTTALSIVSSDFFSKALTMFIGERLMNKTSAGRAKGADSAQRSLTKALVWRLFAICNTLTFAIFFSKDWSVAGKIAGTDGLFKTFLMFVYERVWAKIQWGKEYLIEFSI